MKVDRQLLLRANLVTLICAAVFAGTAWRLQTVLAGDKTPSPTSKATSSAKEIKKTSDRSVETKSDKVSKAREDDVDYKAIQPAQWKKRLTSEQYKVARQHGTEPAFSGKYHDFKGDGVFRCVCCGERLFDSENKFDSGTGWPSFWQPRDKEAVGESKDVKLGYPRTEIHCSRCDAHLGHVFEDAPQTPTGLRYCINSVCLDFKSRKSDSEEDKTQPAEESETQESK